MHFPKWLLATAALTLAPALAHAANGPNLVTNGGFETGTLTGWTGDGASVQTADFNTEGVHSGTFAAFFGEVGNLGSITQTINTTVGQSYDFSFYFASDGKTPNDFRAAFGGNTVFDSGNNAPASAYALEDFTVVATSATTDITFSGRNDPDYQALDDVSVNAISSSVSAAPEPGAWALMLGGVGMLGAFLRIQRARRREDDVKDIAPA